MHRLKASPIACVIGVVALAPGLEAQARSDAVAASAWPSSWSPDVAGGRAAPQQPRLPVYDDAGVVIPFEAIQARVDPGGGRGAFWMGLAGLVAGSAIGAGLADTDCGGIRGDFLYYCSPRQEALNSALPAGLGAVLGVLGAWAGWEGDRTTWDEALAEIRSERRGSQR